MRVIFGGNSDIGKAIEGKHIPRKDCDVSCYADVAMVMCDEPDEVVNCAGIILPHDTYGYMDEIEVNLIGSFNIASLAHKDTKMVFIGSTSGLHGRKGWSGYCASKAGVISMVQSLALDGYQIWCVSPGRVRTKMRKASFPDDDPKTLLRPIDVARVVEDCFSGKYKTGSNIIVRRGYEIEVQD
jgi:NAD(P)-dependent dehydrogenase (short-subunit alcohol dehydrogenase family)